MHLRWTHCIAALCVSLSMGLCAKAELDIVDAGQGQFPFAAGQVGELSGITYLGGDQYIVVGDGMAGIGFATIGLDLSTGHITGTPTIDSQFTLPGTADNEGIAYDPRDASILVSDESNQTINRFAIDDASLLGSVTVPSVFGDARSNLGLESLSFDAMTNTLWTANEEALLGDGPRATDTTGTLVRLQRFDALGNDDGQFAYLTDPHPGNNGIVTAQLGVADLIALPTGDLLVLERGLGGAGFPSFTISLYLIDLEGATDVSAIDDLDGATFDTADKTLLHTFNSGSSNFEGAALGPRLDNGDYALLLVSDDGATFNPQQLLALRLTGLAMPGDLDGDFFVDANDLDIILAHWDQTVDAGVLLQGDTNGDGVVGTADLNAVLDHWGQGAPPTTSIPEPASAATLGLATWITFGRRR